MKEPWKGAFQRGDTTEEKNRNNWYHFKWLCWVIDEAYLQLKINILSKNKIVSV